MSEPAEPRRRFAPVHIETTFDRIRKNGPAAELTPSPSPRSASPLTPVPQEKRRFAPQLVESIRRTRRAGDDGPATKHTDRTDITPYTNHIYAPRSRRRHGHSRTPVLQPVDFSRRESCDDAVAGGVFDLLAKDAQTKLDEVAMSAFPNSNIRTGGAEHFYVREGSEDEVIAFRGRPTTRRASGALQRASRRNSSEEDMSWAYKEMQRHVQKLDRMRERVSTLDLDNMSMDSPPSDAMGLTSAQRASMSGSPLWTASRTSGSLHTIGEHPLPYVRAESPMPTIGESGMPFIPSESPVVRPIGESVMPYIPSAPPGKAGYMPYVPASQVVETGFGSSAAFAPPSFGGFEKERDMSLENLRNFHRQRAGNAPPMLGSDLSFRMCPSPKHTKLEPDHMFDLETGTTEEPNRDQSGERGLWRGYCYTDDKTEKLAPAERPAMLSTPFPETTEDPFAKAFSETDAAVISEEPTHVDGTAPRNRTDPSYQREGNAITDALANGTKLKLLSVLPASRPRNQEPKGLHLLRGLDERLRAERAAADLEEKVQAEFNDKFITQTYNYVSLGYPSTARYYDEELSKISGITIEELRRDDVNILNSVKGARGYIQIEHEEKYGVKEEDRCLRWKALKFYIHEWARQHPDLNAMNPLGWGVRERRGSWGV